MLFESNEAILKYLGMVLSGNFSAFVWFLTEKLKKNGSKNFNSSSFEDTVGKSNKLKLKNLFSSFDVK